MAQRPRRSRNYRPESTGSNVLFTLGLISVVALLIIGWVMTRGGIDTHVFREKEGLTSFLFPTPTPALPISTVPTAPITLNTTGEAAGHAANSVPTITPSVDMDAITRSIASQYEAKVKEMKEQHTREIENIRLKYQSQIDELQKRLMLLDMEKQAGRKP